MLVRYGEWQDNKLTAHGRHQMQAIAATLKRSAVGTVLVVAGEVDRALESARLIAQVFDQSGVTTYPEMYAAEEDSRPANPRQAYGLLHALNNQADTIIAVVSREYIETLPRFIATEVFHNRQAANNTPAHLDRGTALLIDPAQQKITLLVADRL